MASVTRNYLYTASYQLFSLLVPLVTAPYLARVVGATKVGINSYVMAVASIVCTASLLGMYSYGNRSVAYVRDDKVKLNELFWELMTVRLFQLVAACLVYIALGFRSDYEIYFIAYLPWVVAAFIDVSWIFVGTENMKPAMIKNFFAKLVAVVGLFVFVRTQDDSWKYLLVIGAGTVAANLWVYGELRHVVSRPKVNLRHVKGHLLGAFQLFLPQAAVVTYTQAGRVMLEGLTGSTAQVAFYDQAEKIVLLPMTLILALSTVMMPRIANEFRRGRIDVVESLIDRAGRVAMFCAAPMAVGIASIATWFVPWYLGSEFRPTILGMIVLSPIVVLNSLEAISGGQFFTATNQTGKLLASYGAAAGVSLGVNWTLIPVLGFAGSAVATVAASFTAVVVQFWFFRKQVSTHGILRGLLKYLLMAIPTGVAAIVIGCLLGGLVLTTVLQISVGSLLFFLMAWAMKDDVMRDLVERASGVLRWKARS